MHMLALPGISICCAHGTPQCAGAAGTRIVGEGSRYPGWIAGGQAGSRKHLLEGGAARDGARHGRLRQNCARDASRHVELVRRVDRLAAPADVGRHHQGGGAVLQRNLQTDGNRIGGWSLLAAEQREPESTCSCGAADPHLQSGACPALGRDARASSQASTETKQLGCLVDVFTARLHCT